MRFCTQCGSALAEDVQTAGVAVAAPGMATAPPTPAPTGTAGPVGAPAAERRLVSVLFADLVGFTTISEKRDAEEVRELLSRYFDTCRRLISLYGGTVEKFIGDAVMAVWGAPTATEDDAERAVRAALDLVAAVSALGQEVGAEELRARAGVLTGEAAVTLGATGEGMVAGDLVNTASRVQSVAEPGSVFVGEATRRAAEQAIVFEEAGNFELKGKEGTTPLWKTLRVVSGVRGQLKSQGLEAPFVGRDRELRQIKDLFHVCADERRPQLVSVTGIAGIGKSRLAWEFYKYFDGIAQLVYWHRGRCLAYGEGVTYWALADMVRMRCRIAEDDEPEAAAAKLRATLEEHVLDAEDRRFVEPRLAQLLGLGEQETGDRQDLFAAWRLFFERLSETYPTVLVFEDMQWADAALLDFVEYLLEWSRSSPILVVTLARPELLEKRPTWGAGHRNFSSIYLEPLSGNAMEELLAGLVPGLPSGLREQILERAEGVPLYAVETVRMLLDRGLLVEEGSAYRVVGEVETLEVPETLHALVAARLDGLSPDERRLLGDAAVLGKTFTPGALAALTGADRAQLEELLGALVKREVLGVQADPRSPEHGQYGFLQDLLRHVAYETLPKRERRAKHLAAADFLGASLAEDEVAEVVASHLVEAYRLDPDAPDAAELRIDAQGALTKAGERAASLGASAEALRYFEQAGELAADPSERVATLSRAGEMATQVADLDRASALYDQASELYSKMGDTHGAARVATLHSLVDVRAGRYETGLERLEAAYESIAGDEPDDDLARLLVRLGATYWGLGDLERAIERIDRGLEIAESLRVPEALMSGWRNKAGIISPRRPQEARGLWQLALETARASDLTAQTVAAYGDLSDFAFKTDSYAESMGYLAQGLELARKRGDRSIELYTLAEMSYALYMLGRWDESLARMAEIPDEQIGPIVDTISVLTGPLQLHIHRGELAEARTLLAAFDHVRTSPDTQARGAYAAAEASLLLAEGRPANALAVADRVFETTSVRGLGVQDAKQAYPAALEAALALGEGDRVEALLGDVEQLPVGLRSPYLNTVAVRFRARLAGDDPSAEARYGAVAAELLELQMPFHAAVAELELAEWLARQGRPDDAERPLAGARETFERLRATPWIERAAALRPSPAVEISA
jgi:class 3 adenylate cyclase/tetratricopeptide (TPR) repeat protein